MNPARNLPRKTLETGVPENKKSSVGRATHWLASKLSPPPVTMRVQVGWKMSARVQVCSTRVKPSCAPRRLGSAAKIVQGFGHRAKQQIEQAAAVREDHRAQPRGQGEDDVEVVRC